MAVRRGNEKMDMQLQEMREKILDAEFILVGLGEGFQYSWGALVQDDRYREIEREIGDNESCAWIVPFLQKMVLSREREKRWDQAYQALKVLVADKNYFVVSLCIDDYLYGAGLEEKRLVTPCGGFRMMQCDRNCAGELSKIPDETYEAVLQYYKGERPLSDLEEPVCEKCCGKLRFYLHCTKILGNKE